MKTPPVFDRIAVGGLGLVALLIGLVVARGDQVGAQILRTIPGDGGQVSVHGRIGLVFRQPMRMDALDGRFEIRPTLPGRTGWEGNTFWFTPSQTLDAAQTYTVSVKPGGASKDGRILQQSIQFRFRTRPLQVLYLSLQDQKPDLWRQSLSGGPPVQLTFTSGGVYDYAVSSDGEEIAYSASNTLHGIDLWVVARDGSQNRKWVDCSMDHCIQPAWSPDGKQLVYSRTIPQKNQFVEGGPGGLYSIDFNSGQSTLLNPGSLPSFSPDGAWLVANDSPGKRIVASNMLTGDQFQVKGSTDQIPTWFPDGSKMIYSDLQTGIGIPQENLFQIDFKNKKVSQILNQDAAQVEYSLPSISPDGRWMVTALHWMAGGETRQLWLMDVAGKERQAITQDELFTHSHYSWDPWGKSVLYQQIQWGSSDSLPSIQVWDRATESTRSVVQNGTWPSWLP